MNNRLAPLEDAFPRRTQPLFVAGLVVGDPFLEATRGYMDVIVDAGVDIIQLIAPFSEPAYDGPVVRRACDRAMSENIGWSAIQDLVADFRRENSETPIIVSTYLNRILARGVAQCAQGLNAAGVDAIRVSDLPFEEARTVRDPMEQQDVALLQSVGPSTSKQRFRRLEKQAQGMLVWTGHCGAEVTMKLDQFQERVRDLRQYTSLPIVASMSVESGEDAALIAQASHGVLVESAIAWLIEGLGSNVEERLQAFVADLRANLDAGAE